MKRIIGILTVLISALSVLALAGCTPGSNSAPAVAERTPGSSSASAVGGTLVKWHPGNYAASNAILRANGDCQWATVKAEIDLSLIDTNVAGFLHYIAWGAVEPTTQGIYDWTCIDQARSYIASRYPTKRYIIDITPEQFDSDDPTDNGSIPAYILKSSIYGPVGPDGVHYGYWTIGAGQSGAYAAIWRAPIANAFVAMWAALAAHTSPACSCTYDTDPRVEAISWSEASSSDAYSTGGDSTNTSANFRVGWDIVNSGLVAAWPHTNVVNQLNYPTDSTTCPTTPSTCRDAVDIVDDVYAARGGEGGPDFYGIGTSYDAGQSAFLGNVPGSRDLRGKMPQLAFIEGEDYPWGLSFINTTVQTGLKASHEIWWILQDASAGDWTLHVKAFVDANPVPSANQVCPTAYSTGAYGGCNTT
jgi:hypothetical protein